MKRWSTFLGPIAVLGVLFASCGAGPDLDPDKIATITGKYLDAYQDPLKETQIGMWVLDTTDVSLASYSYSEPTYTVTTDDKGRFEFEAMGREFILEETGASRYVIIANMDTAQGPVTAMGFYVLKQKEEMPDARLWKANVSHSISNNDIASFHWEDVEVLTDQVPDYYSFSARYEYWDLWHVDSVQKDFRIPAYVFQNLATGWRIQAFYSREDEEGVDWSYQSETRSGENILPDESFQVVSKQAPAYAQGHASTNFEELTDQKFHQVETFEDSNPEWIMIDLGESRSVAEVGVYGLSTSYASQPHSFERLEVYLTDDTTDWGEYEDFDTAEDGYIHFGFSPRTGRFLKLEANEESNLRISSIREIAVFARADTVML